MTNVFDGRAVADTIASRLKTEVSQLAVKPKLAIVAVNPDARSSAYIKAKMARAEEIGIETELCLFNNASQAAVERTMDHLANDDRVHGIMVQLPVPAAIDKPRLLAIIPADKDVDGMNFITDPAGYFQPATAAAVVEILIRSGITVKEKPVTLVGYGDAVGKPLAVLLRDMEANLTVADETTAELAAATRRADVLIAAAGQPHLITADMVRDNAAVIDSGVSIVDGKSVGDVDFEAVKAKARFITPPTGGVGPMTVVMLLQNVAEAARLASS